MIKEFLRLCKTVLPTISTKKEQALYSDKIIYEVLEGNINPIDLAIALRSIKEVCDTVIKNNEFIEVVQNEAASFGREKVVRFGVEINVRNSSTRYDYSETKEWNTLNTEFEAIKERKALLEEALRLLKQQNELEYQKGVPQSKESESCYYIDEETGEEIHLTTPAKAVKGTSIVLKFPFDKTKKN